MDQILQSLGSIAILVAIFVGWVLFQMLLRAAGNSVIAAGKTIAKGGSFKENFNMSMYGMPALQLKFKDVPLNDTPGSPIVKEIEVFGRIPIKKTTRIGFVTSILDFTAKDQKLPVMSYLDQFQEKRTYAYQHFCEIGRVEPNQGFIKWIRVGVVIPELLQPAYRGDRKLCAFLRMVDLDNPPTINEGFHGEGAEGKMLWIGGLNFDHHSSEIGYREAQEYREESLRIVIAVGVSVAMENGDITDSKGNVIKKWITKHLTTVQPAKAEYIKKLCNDGLSKSYEDSKLAKLSISALTQRLNEIGEKRFKYEAYELSYDIAMADGKIDSRQMALAKAVADSLKLDLAELGRIRDHKIIQTTVALGDDTSAEEVLGIGKDWDNEKIKRHLRDEFQKWNNRLNSLPPGDERDNAQRILELIAETRKKCA